MKAAGLNISILLVFTLCQIAAYSQQKDTTYIKDFERKNTVEVYPGFYHSGFGFSNGKRSDHFLANSSGYLGLYVGYKWLSFSHSVSLPSTFLRNDVKFKYSEYRFGFTKNSIKIRPFYTSYKGLLIKSRIGPRNKKLNPSKEIHYQAAGVYFMYFVNTKKYSYDVANYFAGQQLKSSGSLFFTIKPSWERIKRAGKLTDTSAPFIKAHLRNQDNSWASLLSGVGYNHVFSIDHGRWLISPLLSASAGPVKYFNNSQNKIKPGCELNTALTAGYNGPIIYSYINSAFRFTNLQLGETTFRNNYTDISVTIGYRFKNYKRKIVGYL